MYLRPQDGPPIPARVRRHVIPGNLSQAGKAVIPGLLFSSYSLALNV